MKLQKLLPKTVFLILVLLHINVFANTSVTIDVLQQTISGTVKDAQGTPLPGASIIEKGTTIGTQTDFDGNFTLNVSDANATLLISYIGFRSVEVVLDGRTSLDVTLEEDTAKLDEVVVIGYGTQKREEVTSAIAKVNVEDFNAGNVNNPQQLLQGKVAGLNIARVGGNPNQPFAIRLRGLSTFGNNSEPLVIVDGVIGGSLGTVDPSDIESIDVLKDASAGAIYGTRGSSGVIIITTKSGQGQSKPTLEYRGYVAAESLTNVIGVANREQFLAQGGTDFGSNTNWLDETSRTAISTVHNLSYSGSSTNGLSYRASINYRDIQGVTNNTGFEQLNGRLNVTQRLLDNKLKLSAIVSATDNNRDIGFDQALRYALTFNPTAPIFENRSASDLGRDPNLYGGYFETGVQDVFNPVALTELNVRKEEGSTLLSNFKADLELVKGLTVSANFSRQVENFTRGQFFPGTALFNGANVNGRASREAERKTSQLFEITANYRGELNDFNYEILGGYSFQKFDFQIFGASNSDFITNEVTYNNLGLGVGINSLQAAGVYSNREEAKLSAVLGRFNLNYKNLAFMSTSIRSEESSRFGPNQRRGTFWAVSGGLNLASLIDVSYLDQLKFRAGYGVTGNEPTQRLEFLERLGSVGSGFSSGDFITAIGPVSNPNPDLKWEEKGEFNIGLDFALFDSRLSGALDYFNRKTDDLLNQIVVPSPPNLFNSTIVNLGELKTTGFEAQMNFAAIDNENFSWDIGGNISTFQTTLVNLNDQDDFQDFRGNLGPPGLNGIEPIVVKEGEKLGQIRAGIFAGFNDAGETLIINQETGEPTTERNLDRDGVIVGNGLPDFTFGLNNTLKYKNWDLNFFLRGAVGHSLVNVARAYWEHPSLAGRQNFVVTDGFNPADTEQDAYHSGYVEKADFIRLDNATFGYNVNLPDNSLINYLRIYVAANNLFTITGYSGSDPEVRYSDPGPLTEGNANLAYGGDILVPGIDRRVTALPTKTITFGVNIKL
ncbi:MAG: SusC/RagA family TonB-linked outer membrane protein [Bacteroidota bacterium]|nr:SusC/RagA family TonB-linked outer membrane protein [Bacteroidota bacterium]